MNIEAHLATLTKRHGDLEEELHSAMNQPSSDATKIMEIKRRKLRIKDVFARRFIDPAFTFCPRRGIQFLEAGMRVMQ